VGTTLWQRSAPRRCSRSSGMRLHRKHPRPAASSRQWCSRGSLEAHRRGRAGTAGQLSGV
jgi:hypothetical protein